MNGPNLPISPETPQEPSTGQCQKSSSKWRARGNNIGYSSIFIRIFTERVQSKNNSRGDWQCNDPSNDDPAARRFSMHERSQNQKRHCTRVKARCCNHPKNKVDKPPV